MVSPIRFLLLPEVCVEIKSPSNAEAELQAKVRLYLDAGAKEVWLVDFDGLIRIYGHEGFRAVSVFNVDSSAVTFDVAEVER